MTEFLHPSVSSKVTDNSFVFTTATGTTALFQCILAEKGEDNVLRMMTSPDEFLFKYGTPNLSKYGQASYNVLEWLKNGGVAYVLRVLPTTATYAVTGLALSLAKDVTKSQVAVRNYAGQQFTQLGGMDNFLTTETNTTGSVQSIPLGIIYPTGRGAGYNGLGARISLRDDLDGTYNFRTYNFETTAKDSLGADVTVEGPFLVSFDPAAKNKSRESVYWATVVNKYSSYLRIRDNRKAFDAASDAIAEFIGDEDLNPGVIDILFGRVRDTDATDLYGTVSWVNSVNANTAIPALASILPASFFVPNSPAYLSGGTDGAWTGGDAEDALLVKAYSGITDPTVLDKLANEFDILLDANYAPSVKDAIADLASSIRGDCLALLDLSFQANETQTIAFRKDSVGVSHRNVAIFAHHMDIYDAYNGENVTVTTPYLLASKIPTVDDQYGLHWTFVGPRRGVISGYENLNFIPNDIWKEQLYKAQINYIEKDPKKVNLASQLTSQTQSSALSDINNVRALLRIEREVRKMMADYRMEFNDSTTYDSMNYDLVNYLQTWVANRACITATGSVYASDYDRQQKLARVKIELVFTGIIERVAIDIIINR